MQARCHHEARVGSLGWVGSTPILGRCDVVLSIAPCAHTIERLRRNVLPPLVYSLSLSLFLFLRLWGPAVRSESVESVAMEREPHSRASAQRSGGRPASCNAGRRSGVLMRAKRRSRAPMSRESERVRRIFESISLEAMLPRRCPESSGEFRGSPRVAGDDFGRGRRCESCLDKGQNSALSQCVRYLPTCLRLPGNLPTTLGGRRTHLSVPGSSWETPIAPRVDLHIVPSCPVSASEGIAHITRHVVCASGRSSSWGLWGRSNRGVGRTGPMSEGGVGQNVWPESAHRARFLTIIAGDAMELDFAVPAGSGSRLLAQFQAS